MYQNTDSVTIGCVRICTIDVSFEKLRVMPFDVFRSNYDFDLHKQMSYSLIGELIKGRQLNPWLVKIDSVVG